MDESTFDMLMDRLQTATWELGFSTDDTKMFMTVINNQGVELYNVLDPLYVNGLKPDLTEEQTNTVLSFVTNTLLVDFASDIEAIDSDRESDLNTAIQTILIQTDPGGGPGGGGPPLDG